MQEPSLADLADVETSAKRSRDDRARAGRGEVEPTLCRPEPERPHSTASDVEHRTVAVVEPRRGHGARSSESTRVVRPEFHEREDRLGVDRHLGLGALDAIARSASSFSTIPLWTPTTAPWRMGWLFAAMSG